jgi:hypothetical protein
MATKFYISGPVSGRDYGEAFREFERAEKKIGGNTVNPLKLAPFSITTTWADYMAIDLKAILDGCTDMYFLRNWQHSRGARVEYAVAKMLGLGMSFVDKREQKQWDEKRFFPFEFPISPDLGD